MNGYQLLLTSCMLTSYLACAPDAEQFAEPEPNANADTDADTDAVGDTPAGGGSAADSCGDGILQNTERCDTAIAPGNVGACPAAIDCQDEDPCRKASLTGDGCSSACIVDDIVAPADGDGCCPSGASSANDNDCADPLLCDNGVVDPGEQCDTAIIGGPGACPRTANDCPNDEACSTISVTQAGTCQAACQTEAITTAVDGDGCCLDAGNTAPSDDSDCPQLENYFTCDANSDCTSGDCRRFELDDQKFCTSDCNPASTFSIASNCPASAMAGSPICLSKATSGSFQPACVFDERLADGHHGHLSDGATRVGSLSNAEDVDIYYLYNADNQASHDWAVTVTTELGFDVSFVDFDGAFLNPLSCNFSGPSVDESCLIPVDPVQRRFIAVMSGDGNTTGSYTITAVAR